MSDVSMFNLRIGQGIDVHPFGAATPLVLGGVTIPNHSGLKAHSDGDAVIHALVDALLGAAGLGDIGSYYPSEDPVHAGKNSRIFLVETHRKLSALGFRLINADITIMTQSPKLLPHIPAMKDCLAQDLQCEASQLNVKGTTTDHLGFIGRKEGLMTSAVVLLHQG